MATESGNTHPAGMSPMSLHSPTFSPTSKNAASPISPTFPHSQPPLNGARSSRPISTAGSLRSPPLSPRLMDDKIERAFDDVFRSSARRKKGASMTLSELQKEPHGIPEEEGEKVQSPLDKRYSSYVDDWTLEPASLETPAILFIVVDVLLTAMPLLCVIYAVCAASLNGRPTSSSYFLNNTWSWSAYLFGPSMMFAQKLVPTLFPMIFGVEIARLIKTFALYRAERGTRIGFIEQLMGSQSLGGTIAALWGLRLFNIVGFLLFCLWGLAPVGGQAGLRILSNNGTLVLDRTLSYMSTNATPPGLSSTNDDVQYYKYAVDSIFATNILTPNAMTSPQDTWANVKIPSIEWFERNGGCDSDGWCSWGHAKQNNSLNPYFKVTAGTYSSLTGVPVVGGIFGLGVQNFSLETSYFAFDCASLENIDPTTEMISALPNRSKRYNTEADSPIWTSSSADNPYTFFVDTDTPVKGVGDAAGDARDNWNSSASTPPRNIIFGSRAPNATSLATCTVTLTHVESQVLCNFTSPLWTTDLVSSGRSAAGACRVEKMRRSSLDTRPARWTPLDEAWQVPQRFFDAWPGSTGIVPAGTSSPTERFMNDVVTNSASDSSVAPLVAANWLGFGSSSSNGSQYVDLANSLDITTFTERFGLLFNTYWHSFCNLQAMTETEIGLGFTSLMPSTVMFNDTDVHMQLPGDHYVVHWAYLAVFLVCTLVALGAGILAMVLKYNTLVPDVLGSISTLTRDNPHTHVPAGGSALDGADFARHVMHMPVRFVDITPNEALGHIALSTIPEEDDGDSAKLRKGRLYA